MQGCPNSLGVIGWRLGECGWHSPPRSLRACSSYGGPMPTPAAATWSQKHRLGKDGGHE